MDAADDFANWRVWTAVNFQRARRAVQLARPIDNGVGLRDVCPRLREWAPLAAQRVPFGTAVFVGLFVPVKFAARDSVVITLRSVPNRHMRLDSLLIDHPPQNFCGAVIGVTDQAIGLEIKTLLDPG